MTVSRREEADTLRADAVLGGWAGGVHMTAIDGFPGLALTAGDFEFG